MSAPRKPSFFQQIMDEHVHMPGFPQLIVRRGYVHSYYKRLGWDESERGYGSLDYTVFASPKTSEPLTEADFVEDCLTHPDVVEALSR